MCSANDDPTTYDEIPAYLDRVLRTADLETAIAKRNIAWAAWKEQADRFTSIAAYNQSQDDYEYALLNLIRERVRFGRV